MGNTHICQYGQHPFYIIKTVIKLKLERIRDLREDNDLKQKDLALYLSVDQSTYSDYENGRINIPLDMLIKIADYYNVSLDNLAGRSNNKDIN